MCVRNLGDRVNLPLFSIQTQANRQLHWIYATLRNRIVDTMVSVHFWKDTVTFRLGMSFQYASDTFIYAPNAFRYDSEAFVCNLHTFQ